MAYKTYCQGERNTGYYLSLSSHQYRLRVYAPGCFQSNEIHPRRPFIRLEKIFRLARRQFS